MDNLFFNDFGKDNVTLDYVREFEKKHNINFPEILVDYYTNHNTAEIKEFSFFVHNLEFSIDFIIPLKYRNYCVEKILSFNETNEYIPKTFFPLAADIEGDDFYWDSSNGKVYYLSLQNVENPIPICDSVEQFFKILNESCKRKYSAEPRVILTENPNMNDLKFVHKMNERVWIPREDTKPIYTLLKKCVWGIVAVIVVTSIIFQDNMFMELSWYSRISLISLIITFGFYKPKDIAVSSPIEIRFYDDYLIVYREKRYYSSKTWRLEYNKFYYSDVTRLDYDYEIKRLNIVGKLDAMWFNYNKDGTVPTEPTYHRIVDGGICYMYLYDNDEEILIKTIEENSGLKVQQLYKPDNSK